MLCSGDWCRCRTASHCRCGYCSRPGRCRRLSRAWPERGVCRKLGACLPRLPFHRASTLLCYTWCGLLGRSSHGWCRGGPSSGGRFTLGGRSGGQVCLSGPGGLRLVLAPLRARSSAVSASTAAWSPWTVRRLPSAVGSWVRKTLLAWASAEPGLGRSSGACRLSGVSPGASGRLVALLCGFGSASWLARSASSTSVPSASPRACCVGGSGSAL